MRLRDWTLQYNLIWAANEKPPTDCVCPEGYEPYQDECRKVTTKPAVKPDDWNPMGLVEKPGVGYPGNYNAYGFRFYNSDFDIGSSMWDSTKYTNYYKPSEYLYWWNSDLGNGNGHIGPMNRAALWTTSTFSNQSIGFATCINIGETKTYYVGIGVDNYMSIRVDGTYLINMAPIEDFIPFRYWHMYPIEIKKGFHILEVVGSNKSSIASVGIQIYDATPTQLLAVTSDAELAPYLVFDSANEIGNYHTLGDYAYPIDPDYALVTCDGTPYYRNVEYQPCA